MKYATFWLMSLLFGGLAGGFFSACDSPEALVDPYRHIADPEARSLLAKAMETAGGLDRWRSKESLLFRKDFTLYDETGAVERSVVETHDYRYRPEEVVRISWQKDSAVHEITYRAGRAVKTIDGRPDAGASPESLRNTVLSATYVVSIPFKLLDEGVELTSLGQDTLEDGQVVQVIRGIFNPEEHDNHSTPDIWWYYFAAEDHRLAAYMVKHADHYSYVKNEDYMMLDGFLFPRVRKSYRVDAERKVLYLRAAYVYEGMEN